MMFLLLVLVAAVLVGVCSGQSRRVVVTEPRGNAELTAGSVTTVRWNSTGLQSDDPMTVAIYDARNWIKVGGLTIIDRADLLIASFQTRNSGAFQFVVPIVPADKNTFYVVVAYAVDPTVVLDQSEQFRVKLLTYSLTVTAPPAAARVLTGDALVVKWSAVNISASVLFDVRLKRASSASLLTKWLPVSAETDVAAIAYKAPNNGSLSWSMPLSVPPGDSYVVHMRWRDTDYEAFSAPFSVAAGTRRLTVTQPSAALGWSLLNTQKTVAWTAVGFDAATTRYDLVLFQLANGSQTAVATLATGVAGPRTYVDLPPALAPGTYYVELSVAGQPSLVATSESFVAAAVDTAGVYRGEAKNNIDAPFFSAAPRLLAPAALALCAVAAGALL